jgi:hypothetical protein
VSDKYYKVLIREFDDLVSSVMTAPGVKTTYPVGEWVKPRLGPAFVYDIYEPPDPEKNSETWEVEVRGLRQIKYRLFTSDELTEGQVAEFWQSDRPYEDNVTLPEVPFEVYVADEVKLIRQLDIEDIIKH